MVRACYVRRRLTNPVHPVSINIQLTPSFPCFLDSILPSRYHRRLRKSNQYTSNLDFRLLPPRLTTLSAPITGSSPRNHLVQDATPSSTTFEKQRIYRDYHSAQHVREVVAFTNSLLVTGTLSFVKALSRLFLAALINQQHPWLGRHFIHNCL